MIARMRSDYELLDSGKGQKFERFGNYTLIRPSTQALWNPQLPDNEWDKSNALFSREGQNRWIKEIKERWTVQVAGIKFRLDSTDFGHLGIFPEQQPFWEWIQRKTEKGMKVLNLFAYSGGSTLAAAKSGAEVVHLDASKGMIAWAKENAALNDLEKAPIRWIADDAIKFLKREVRRESRYDAIILDPPSFGRGTKGEVFKIDEEIQQLLHLCHSLLSPRSKYLLFSCHTPGYTPTVMHNLLTQIMGSKVDSGEMYLKGKPGVFFLPSGTFARWSADGNH